MRRIAEINLERPTLSAIRRSLPVERTHLFLRLMPYSYSAPYAYGELQTAVYHALVTDDSSRCVEALEQLAALYDHGLSDLPARDELLAEVAFRIRQRHFSCLAAELEFVTRLGMDDITLDEFQVRGEVAGVPMLVGKVRWWKGKPMNISSALRSVEEAVAALTAMSAHEIAAMPVRERMAGIRLIRLFCLFGTPGEDAPVGESRWQFFFRLGQPTWRALADGGLGDQPTDPGLYGEPAMRRMEVALAAGRVNAHLHDQDESSGESAASEVKPLSAPVDSSTRMHLVVTDAFPTSRDGDDRALLKEFEPLRQPMPVARMPTPKELDQKLGLLIAEFPWAEQALQVIFNELRARSVFGSVRLGCHPILLRGPAGCGKSRLARRLADVLGVESLTMSLAGASDSMGILGTSRGWSSGQPSPLLRPLLKGCATVLMCFDELDKAANSARNSPPIESALLALLEPQEVQRWRDPFLQVACDLSPLLFVFTCNSTAHMSGPLLSRLRILDIDRPTPKHFAQVLPYVLKDMEAEWGLPHGALRGIPIDSKLLRGLSSMREVRRVVSTVVRIWLDSMAGVHKH